MSEVRQTTSVRRLRNGKEVTIKMECNQGDAQQDYKGNDADGNAIVAPDWAANDDERPIFWSEVLANTVRIIYTDDNWTYNATLLTFDTNGLSNNTGLVGYFQKVTYQGVPALKIMKNLASEDNQDNDMLYLDFAYKVGGIDTRGNASAQIRIGRAATDVYKGTIMPVNDQGFVIRENGGSIQLHGRLRYGGVLVANDKYTIDWKKQTSGVFEPLKDESGNNIVDPSNHTITITSGMVNSCLNVYAIFKDLQGNELTSDTQGVIDASDPLSISKGAVPANETIIEDSDTVVYTPKVVDSEGNTKTEFNSKFKFFLSDEDGNAITGDYDFSSTPTSSQTITANDVDKADPGELMIEIVADDSY